MRFSGLSSRVGTRGARIVAREGGSGEFRADVDADAAAAGYTSAVLGAEIQFYQDPDRFAFEAAIHTFLDQLLTSLRPPGPDIRRDMPDGGTTTK